MGLKGKIEAIIYAAEEPVSLDHIALLVREPALQQIADERARAEAVQAAAESEAQSSSAAPEPAEVSDNGAAAQSTVTEEVEPQPEQPPVAPAPEQTDETPVQIANAAAEVSPADLSQTVDAADAPQPATPVPDTGVEERSENPSPEPPSSAAAPEQPLPEASEKAKSTVASKRKAKPDIPPEVRAKVRATLEELITDYTNPDRGMEIRQIAGGYRMTTKPEHHDVVKAFAKSLKPPLRLSLPALETLAVIAYKQPVTAPEVGEIRGVDSQGVIATLLDRKLITTAGRKAVIGRPILYKTTKEFLMRFGLNEISELPSMEEFEKLALEAGQVDMFQSEEESAPAATADGIEPATPEDESAVAEGGDHEGIGISSTDVDIAPQPEQDRPQPSEATQSSDAETEPEASADNAESEQANSEEPVH